MRKKKKVKTIIVEKFKYDSDYGITLEPSLLLRLLEFAHQEAKSDEQLHAIVATQGGQGYNLLLETRDRFKELLLQTMEHMRICVEEDESLST